MVCGAGENGVEQGVRGEKGKEVLWGINEPTFNARTYGRGS